MQQFKQALDLVSRGDYGQALRLLDEKEASRSSNPEILGLYSHVTLKLGYFDRCRSSLQKALRKQPKNPRFLRTLFELQMALSQSEAAIKTARKILTDSPHDPDARVNLGRAYYAAEKFDDAEREFLHVLGKVPGNVAVLIYLGLVCEKQRRYQDALDFYDRALKLDPESAVALQNKGVTLNQLFMPDAAVKVLEHAHRIRPNSATICQNLATAYVLGDEPEKAHEYFARAIRLQPLNPDHHHWCNLFLWRENSEHFLRSYEEVLSHHPDASDLRRDMVGKLRLAGRTEEAEQQLNYLLENHPDDPENYRLLGDVLRKQRRFPEALDAHRKAARLGPQDPAIQESLATSFLSVGEAARALDICDRLLRGDRKYQGYWALKAIALRMLGRDEYHEIFDYERLVLREKIDVPDEFGDLKQFNEELLENLAQYHNARAQPLDQSLLHGTQSSGDLFNKDSAILKKLKAAFDNRFRGFLEQLPSDINHPVLSRNTGTFRYAGAWSVMLSSSGHHVNHFHNSGWYSGPYYVSLPPEVSDENNRDGWIKLGEPGFEMAEPLEADFVVRPEEGLMIRFPSYMWHGTYPFQSDSKRVIVACDLVP